jgi:hypothetical protein
MIAPDDATLRRMACGDGSVSDDATYAAALAAEVLSLRATIDALHADADEARCREIERHQRMCAALEIDEDYRAYATDAEVEAAAVDAVCERDALRAILTPRTTPPTPAEMAAHGAAGGVWLTAWPWRTGVWTDDVVPALRARDAVEPGMTWLPLDAQRRPCAWPTPARLPGCETVGPCGYCDHPERPR